MILKSLAALLISCLSFTCWAQSTEARHLNMEKALAIFERLSSSTAAPLTQDFIELVTSTKLVPPDEKYSPSVQKMLIDKGIDPSQRSRFLHDFVQINDEIKLKIQFAAPIVELSFSGQTRNITVPKPLTNEALAVYLNSITIDRELAIKRNCIRRQTVSEILERNGWILTEHPLSADIDAEEGNFYFARLKDFSTVTADGGCVVSLQIGAPLPR
ncbi:MAG: hypothetical protein ACK41V_22935 [Acidovorax sp.]